jgi:hypothetical protein
MGGVPRVGGGGGGSQKSQIRPHVPQNVRKQQKNGDFVHFSAYKLLKSPFFAQKYLTRYTTKTFFKEYINFEIFVYLRHCGVMYTCSKFWKSYTPPAAQIRVKHSTDHGSFEHNRTIKTRAKNRQIYIIELLYKGSNELTECMLHQYAINISAEET